MGWGNPNSGWGQPQMPPPTHQQGFNSPDNILAQNLLAGMNASKTNQTPPPQQGGG